MKDDYISHKKYCYPKPNEIEFISNNQSLSLVLGSCISTVFLGKSEDKGYILSANHIVIADPKPDSIAATKNAEELINGIIHGFNDNFNINNDMLKCLYLIGAGKKISQESFSIHKQNIVRSESILNSLGFDILFNDTRSHISAVFSISKTNLSVLIENIERKVHISFIVDLDKLFKFNSKDCSVLPAISLEPSNKGFELFIKNKIITTITGSRLRHSSK